MIIMSRGMTPWFPGNSGVPDEIFPCRGRIGMRGGVLVRSAGRGVGAGPAEQQERYRLRGAQEGRPRPDLRALEKARSPGAAQAVPFAAASAEEADDPHPRMRRGQCLLRQGRWIEALLRVF